MDPLRSYYENAAEINAMTARRPPTFEEKVALIKQIGAYFKKNLMGEQPEGKWFGDRVSGKQEPRLYSKPTMNWMLGEVDPPGLKGEFIQAAAIKLKNGKVFEGATHHLAMDEFDKVYSIRDWKSLVDDSNGFVTDKGRFLTRDEAVKLTGEKSEDAADILGRSVRGN
jgi:hypothetical protein